MSAARTPAPVRRRGGVLRQRDFRLLWIGETTSALGTSISALALPLVAVVTLGADAFEVGVMTAAAWLPWLLIGLPAGAWVDRLPRRPVLLACNIASALLLLSIPLAAWAGVLHLGQLLVVALLTGTAGVFFQTAMQVYLPTVVGPDDLTAANAMMAGGEAVTHVAGPGVAGVLAQLLGAVAGLVADAASYLGSTACLLLVRAREPERGAAARDTTLRREIAAGLRFVRRDPYLRLFTVFGALSNVALTGYQTVLVVFLVREVGVGPGTVGLVFSGMSVGGILGAGLSRAVTRRFGTARGLLLLQVGGAPFGLLVPLTGPGPGLTWVVVGGIGVGAGVVAGNIIKSTFRQTYTPRELLGRVVVTMQFLNYGTIPVAAVLAGFLGDRVGLRPTMWVMTIGLVLASMTLLFGPIRAHRDLPAAPEIEA